MYKRILIPVDGSELSLTALHKGVAFAKEIGAQVHVLTVIEPFHVFSVETEQLAQTRAEYEGHAVGHAEKLLSAAAEAASKAGVPAETSLVQADHPYEAIIETAAKAGCDLIAMASHGRRGLAAVVLGSQTVKVLTHSTTPVLVYR